MNDKLKSVPDVSLSTPRFQKEAESFARDMAQYPAETIAEMLGCSQQIAAQNKLRFMQFFDEKPKLPAILAYHGQAYKHLKAETLTVDDLNYSQEKLWITSFLYGLLRPLDGILSYRMEGHVVIDKVASLVEELPSGAGQNVFGFWKSCLTEKGKAMEEHAFNSIPSGMDEIFSACPLKPKDYPRLAQELDSIIETLKK